MARKRMIAPSIWEDPSFNSLGITARLAFVGMISNADDDGYLRGDYGSLKRLVFGFDIALDDMRWHQELMSYKNIHFFDVNGETYAHLLNWDKYQTQRDDRRQDSQYPKCVICQASDRQVPAEDKLSKDKLSKVKIERGVADAHSPKSVSSSFFSKSPEEIDSYVSAVAEKTGADRKWVASEVRKFLSYWTERNKSGTKMKWELERTFEVDRRLSKWLQNSQQWSKEKADKPSKYQLNIKL